MGLAPYGEPRLRRRDPATSSSTSRTTARSGSNMRLLRLPRRPGDDQRALRRALRRPAARSRSRRSRSARWTSRARSRWSPRRSCSAWRATPARSPASGTSAWPAAWRSTASANGELLRERIFDDLWIQPAAGDAGGALGAALAVWHNAARQAPARRRAGPRRDAGRAPRARASTPRADPRVPRRATATRTTSSPTASGRRGSPRLIAEREGGRLVPGAHGVRAARARRPLDPRRPALAADAVGDEPEDQVPRELPAVRARRCSRSASPTTSSSTAHSPYMLLVAPVASAGGCRAAAATSARSTIARAGQPAALGHPRDHPRRLLGAHPDGRRATDNPRYHALLARVRGADRLRGAGQHQLQRARRADRLHARGRLPLLHAHRDGLPGARPLPARQGRAAALAGVRELASDVRARLSTGDAADAEESAPRPSCCANSCASRARIAPTGSSRS